METKTHKLLDKGTKKPDYNVDKTLAATLKVTE